ncbi:hypothetical protein EVAR_33459_1 [Eumeta japonica]|uniref:Uncharacterized protein n=1 Tax=Eumeta variegata TaxID=151549 RepID=A0A4C1WHX4_EUMVA|nr:hypothetical protein EVAR_33459_1 [Eumeta japonica]
MGRLIRNKCNKAIEGDWISSPTPSPTAEQNLSCHVPEARFAARQRATSGTPLAMEAGRAFTKCVQFTPGVVLYSCQSNFRGAGSPLARTSLIYGRLQFIILAPIQDVSFDARLVPVFASLFVARARRFFRMNYSLTTETSLFSPANTERVIIISRRYRVFASALMESCTED